MTKTGLMRFLLSAKMDLESGQHIVQGYVSFCRTLVFIIGALVVNIYDGTHIKNFFSPNLTIAASSTLLSVFAIQAVCAMTVYQSCKCLSI